MPSESLRLVRTAGELASGIGVALYLVGGAVRDLLLEKSNFDIDLVVEGDAPALAYLLAERLGGKVVTHRRFGTAKFTSADLSIDLATARAESYERPGALPTVSPSSIRSDLSRRDFTINAMAVHLNPHDFGTPVDPFGGEADLARKLIRVLHEKSFCDDATRMLRAIRYEQRFDFHLEASTEELLRRDLSMLHTISGDRTRHELELILKEENPEKPLGRAAKLGILERIHPSLSGDGWLARSFQRARAMSCPVPLGLGFSLLAYHFGREQADDLIARLRMPKATAHIVQDTLRLKEKLDSLDAPGLMPSAVHQLLKDYSPTSVAACAAASDSPATIQRLQLYLNRLRYVRTSLDGTDLQAMGVPPGPRLGQILRRLHGAKLDRKVKTREEEMRLVRLWLSEEG